MVTRYRYLAGLLLIPLADALLLVVVADVLGWPVTVLLVVLTGLVGMLLVRAEGRVTLSRLQEKLATGELPTNELLDGGLLVAAGAFLLTPGLVTDTIGFLLVLPLSRVPIREAIKRIARPYVERKTDGMVSGRIYTGGFPSGSGDGPGPGPGAGPGGGAPHDLDDDAFEVEFEDESDG